MGSFTAAQALAKSMGLHERKLTPRSLEKAPTNELMNHAIMRGLKVPGDGVTWDRAKLIRHLKADLKGKPLAEDS